MQIKYAEEVSGMRAQKERLQDELVAAERSLRMESEANNKAMASKPLPKSGRPTNAKT